MFRYFFLFVFVCLTVIQLFAGNTPTLVLNPTDHYKRISLLPYLQILVDSTTQKNLNAILLPTVQKQFHRLDIESLDIKAKSIWLRLDVDNKSDTAKKIGLQFGYFEHLTIYLASDTLTKKVAQRSFKRLEDVEYVMLPPHKSTFYFHINRSQPIYISQVKPAIDFAFLHGEYYDYFWETNKVGLRYFSLLFIGAISVMLCYNLILLIILKDKNYLYYVLCLFSFGIADFSERGLYEELVAPAPPTYFLWLILIPVIFYVLFQLLFTRSFLDLPKNMPFLNKIALFLCFLVGSNFLLIAFGAYEYLQIYLMICSGIANLGILCISLLAIRKVKSNITFYLIGNILYNIGVIIYVLDLFQVIESNIYTVNGMLVGNILEMMLFSLALANKINEAKRDLMEEKLLKEQEKKIIILEQNKLLEEKVEQRTYELQESNNKLQQTLKTVELQTEELVKNNLFKDKMFSIIAHDLRSPLGALKGTLALLAIDALSKEEINSMTNDVKRRLDALDVTLNDLLQWAKSQMQGATISSEIIDIQENINQKIALFLPIAEDKKITLLNHIPKNTIAYADLNQFRAIIRNLIANAIKFTSPNGVVIVGAEEEEKDTNFVTIWVKDTGLGMKEEQMKQLFENKTHFTTRGTKGEKGTGLGLLLCKDFVVQNGGRIWVKSELNKGSCFYFTLPKSPTNISN